MNLSPIDVVLLFLVLAGGVCGLLAGAVKVAGPFAFILAAVSLTHAYPDLSSRFGTDLTVQVFLSLLLGCVGLVVYAVASSVLHRAVHVSGLGPFNRFLGLALGVVSGTVLAGAAVWGLETYGGMQGRVLLNGSVLAPAVSECFTAVMAFTQRLLPRPEPEKEPWWRRPLW